MVEQEFSEDIFRTKLTAAINKHHSNSQAMWHSIVNIFYGAHQNHPEAIEELVQREPALATTIINAYVFLGGKSGKNEENAVAWAERSGHFEALPEHIRRKYGVGEEKKNQKEEPKPRKIISDREPDRDGTEGWVHLIEREEEAQRKAAEKVQPTQDELRAQRIRKDFYEKMGQRFEQLKELHPEEIAAARMALGVRLYLAEVARPSFPAAAKEYTASARKMVRDILRHTDDPEMALAVMEEMVRFPEGVADNCPDNAAVYRMGDRVFSELLNMAQKNGLLDEEQAEALQEERTLFLTGKRNELDSITPGFGYDDVALMRDLLPPEKELSIVSQKTFDYWTALHRHGGQGAPAFAMR